MRRENKGSPKGRGHRSSQHTPAPKSKAANARHRSSTSSQIEIPRKAFLAESTGSVSPATRPAQIPYAPLRFAAVLIASLLCVASVSATANPTTTQEGRRFIARSKTVPCDVAKMCIDEPKSSETVQSSPRPPGLTVSNAGRRFVSRRSANQSNCLNRQTSTPMEAWLLIEPHPKFLGRDRNKRSHISKH